MSGSGISWAICSRQITMPVPHHSSFFSGRMPFLMPNQQHQSTEGKIVCRQCRRKQWHLLPNPNALVAVSIGTKAVKLLFNKSWSSQLCVPSITGWYIVQWWTCVKFNSVLQIYLMKAVGCCLFPSTDTVENVPLEARWLFNDFTKGNDNDIRCTFIRPFTDKVSFYCMLILCGFVCTYWSCPVKIQTLMSCEKSQYTVVVTRNHIDVHWAGQKTAHFSTPYWCSHLRWNGMVFSSDQWIHDVQYPGVVILQLLNPWYISSVHLYKSVIFNCPVDVIFDDNCVKHKGIVVILLLWSCLCWISILPQLIQVKILPPLKHYDLLLTCNSL